MHAKEIHHIKEEPVYPASLWHCSQQPLWAFQGKEYTAYANEILLSHMKIKTSLSTRKDMELKDITWREINKTETVYVFLIKK